MIAPTPSPLTIPQAVRVTVHGADTPPGRELAGMLHLHPGVAAAREVACDGSPVVGWDGAAEPRWGDRVHRPREDDADVVFVCLPPSQAAPTIERSLQAGARVIDVTQLPELSGVEDAIYGLPELSTDALGDADLVVNPSGVATCATIALGPAALAGQLSDEVEVQVQVGIPATAPELRPTAEQTERELQENLTQLHRCARAPRVRLQRRVDPVERGVLATAHVAATSARRVHTLYEAFYADAPCVEVLPSGLPALPAVRGTSKAQVGVREDPEHGGVEVTCALDHAIKGVAGQALQNMNRMCGFPETLGLPGFALRPNADAPRVARRPDV